MVPPNNLGPDLNGKAVNETQYRGMIRSLMYLTASRPDIQFLTCLCVRYQANPRESHLIAVKRIFRQAFTRSPNQYKEYLFEFSYTAKALKNLKVWFFTPTRGILGEVRVNTFRTAIGGILPVSLHPICYHTTTRNCGGCSWPKSFNAYVVKLGFFDKISNKDAIILYCLENEVNIDYAKFIWEDIITKLNKKTRKKVVPYPSVHNWTLKKNQPEGPLFTDHMLAICKADVPVEHKALNTSSYTKKKDSKGKNLGAKIRHGKQTTYSKHHPLPKIEATKGVTSEGRANPQISSAKFKSEADFGLSAPKDSISQTTCNDEGPNKLSSDHISAAQLTKLLIKSLKPKFSKILSAHDFSSSLPTELKEIPFKLTELTGEVKELKKHVHDMEIKLPGDLKEIPNKLEVFPLTVKSLTIQVAELKTLQWELPTEFLYVPTHIQSIQVKLKTLDALPSLLNKVTKAMNKFAQVIDSARLEILIKAAKDAEKANLNKQQSILTPPITTTVTSSTTTSLRSSFLSSPLKSSFQPEGEHIKKDKGKNDMSSKDAEEEGSESNFDDTIHLTGSMVESSKNKKLKKFDFVTKGGDHVHLTKEQIKAQKRIEESAKAEAAKHKVEKGKGWPTMYGQIQTRIDYLHETKVKLETDLDKPPSEQDPLDKLSGLAKTKRKNADDIHDYFRANKRLKSSVQYEDHPAETMLNESVLGMIMFNSYHKQILLPFKTLEISQMRCCTLYKKSSSEFIKAIDYLHPVLGQPQPTIKEDYFVIINGCFCYVTHGFKLDKFERVDLRRWQKKMHFLLSRISVLYVLTTSIHEDSKDAIVEQLKTRASGIMMTMFAENSTWFKEKAMLAKALESKATLDEEEMAFLVIVDNNAKVADVENQIHSLKMQLNETVESHKTLSTTVDALKKESKAKEDKYLDQIIDLEKKKKALDNVVYKMGQSTQMMHMLTKCQVFYIESHKTALGYQNHLYLTQAQRKVHAQYCVHMIVKQHAALPIIKNEETLELTEESRLTAEQAFWLAISKSVSEKSPVQPEQVLKEIPHELPKISLVKDSFNKMKSHVNDFDKIITVHNNSLEPDNIEAELLQKKNDRLFELIISQDLVHTAVNSLAEIFDYQNMEESYIDEFFECVKLKAKLLKKNDMVEKAVYDELSK
uniref:Uncharacterized mitochondrial protein AtMg00810-like n=1 Tax=Tanacetum cinerariifolium TaxID=118510 RepID=A0A6L2L5J5_TANCI|nr:uncharacterized mitochondrial protein AtMg00810-like [Tanacetum cinerariifolium]